MRTRACPSCTLEFKRCKKVDKIRTCPLCKIQIHYMSSGETILYEDKLQAGELVSALERHISKRDGINFEFDYAGLAKELKLAYGLIGRAREYLTRQIDIGLSPLEFCMEIIELILSDDFWAKIVKSLAMLMKHISAFATEVFLKHKESIEQKQRDQQVSTFADFLDYEAPESREDTPCFQVATM